MPVMVLVLETRGKDRQADGKHIVVHESGKHGEDAEAEHQEARPEEHRLRMTEAFRVAHEVHPCEGQQRAVADIAIHHSEDEWESDHGDERGVRLLIARDAVSVDDLLEGLRVLVGADVRRRRGLPSALVRVEEGPLALLIALARGLQEGLDLALVALGVPHVHAQRHALLAMVQHVVDGLLLDAEEAPILDLGIALQVPSCGGHEVDCLCAHDVLEPLERALLLLQVLPQDRVLLPGLLGRGGPRVHVHAEGGADLDDLVTHGALHALEVDDEHGFLHDATRLRIDDFVLDAAEHREGVAPRRAPEGPLEALLVNLRHHARDVAQAAVRQRVVADEGRREVAAAGPARRAEDLERGRDHLRLLDRLVPLGHELHVVFLELQELLVQLRELGLDDVELVRAVGGEEFVHAVLLHIAIVDFADLVEHEAQDALHLVDALDVLAVRSAHLPSVHVLELDVGLLADFVDVPPRVLHGQHQHAVLHRL
mmetsp:Transcript_38973/g.117689  ORF Transcript_38973/g.117689 Transcript_38973/m.117689 type:complete len:484 (-) Transcript_38973:107-1558(-)